MITSDIVKASEVIGTEVRNAQNENLGKIEEIMLDKLSGEVNYLVLSFGGFLGLGDKFFAIPWNAISFDLEKECFILNIDKEKLKNAPGFSKDHWPENMNDPTWRESIYSFYGVKSNWTERKAA